jgi:hypothetical protein
MTKTVEFYSRLYGKIFLILGLIMLFLSVWYDIVPLAAIGGIAVAWSYWMWWREWVIKVKGGNKQ